MAYAPMPNGKLPFLYRIPVLGRMARETFEGDDDTPFYAVAIIVGLWGSATLTFGFAGLIIGALTMTALMFLVLVTITRG